VTNSVLKLLTINNSCDTSLPSSPQQTLVLATDIINVLIMPVLHRLLTLSNIPYCHETEVLQEIIETSFLSGSGIEQINLVIIIYVFSTLVTLKAALIGCLTSLVLARCDRKGFYVKVLPLVERSVNSGRKEQWALLCGIKLSPYEYQLIRMRRIQVEHCENKRLLILHHVSKFILISNGFISRCFLLIQY